MGASPEEMDGGTDESRCTIPKKVMALVWTSKPFQKSEMALLKNPRRQQETCRSKTLDTRHRR
jgi:hypothetical protein